MGMENGSERVLLISDTLVKDLWVQSEMDERKYFENNIRYIRIFVV